MRRATALLAIAALIAAPAAVLAAEPFTAQLTGDAEVPPVETDGTGMADVTISDDASSIDFEVTFEGLSGDGTATMAHIHYGSADEAGPVIIWLTEVGVTDGSYSSPLSGTATEAEFMPAEGGPQTFAEALQAIRDGMTYVNVHTPENPGGEIRGQLAAAEQPDDEGTPPPTSTAGPADQPSTGSMGAWLIALAMVGAAALLFGLRRFSLTRE